MYMKEGRRESVIDKGKFRGNARNFFGKSFWGILSLSHTHTDACTQWDNSEVFVKNRYYVCRRLSACKKSPIFDIGVCKHRKCILWIPVLDL